MQPHIQGEVDSLIIAVLKNLMVSLKLKKFENRQRIHEVIDKSLVAPFFTHSVELPTTGFTDP